MSIGYKGPLSAMRRYQHYTIEDFALDVQFRRWVNYPTAEQDRMWEQWMCEFPDKRLMVEQARIIVHSLQPREQVAIDEVSLQGEIDKILLLTQEKPAKPKAARKAIPLQAFSYFLTRVAACIALVASVAWGYWQYQQPLTDRPGKETVAVPLQAVARQIEHVNRGNKPMLVNLPDKSTVLLQKNSRIHYISIFNGPTREVYLEGEAFFEVAKDRQRPFYVYTDEVVTRVVGTSFHVKANPADNNVSVIVKTGRVAVFTKTDKQKTTGTDSTELVLTQNEQLIYRKDDKKVKQTVVKPLEIQRLSMPENNFVFYQTPVSEVFSRLEKNYNVDIQYAGSQLQECDLTASFTDEPFAVKLDLICGAIGVSYQMKGSQVVILGKGCL